MLEVTCIPKENKMFCKRQKNAKIPTDRMRTGKKYISEALRTGVTWKFAFLIWREGGLRAESDGQGDAL